MVGRGQQHYGSAVVTVIVNARVVGTASVGPRYDPRRGQDIALSRLVDAENSTAAQ